MKTSMGHVCRLSVKFLLMCWGRIISYWIGYAMQQHKHYVNKKKIESFDCVVNFEMKTSGGLARVSAWHIAIYTIINSHQTANLLALLAEPRLLTEAF